MKKIFIDGGARIGESIDVLLNKREDLKGCDVYLFECNSDHKITLEEIAKTNNDYNFIVRDEAIWKEDGEMNFFISTDIWGDLGCTLDSSKREKLDLVNPRVVKTINFSEFISSFDENDYIMGGEIYKLPKKELYSVSRATSKNKKDLNTNLLIQCLNLLYIQMILL
jgi:hypothetical protein